MKLLLDFWWDIQTFYWLPRLIVGLLIVAMIVFWGLGRRHADRSLPRRFREYWPPSADVRFEIRPDSTLFVTWKGGPWVWITAELLHDADPKYIQLDGNRIFIGSWRLIKVEYDWGYDVFLCVRDTWRGRLSAELLRRKWQLKFMYYRLLRKFQRWGWMNTPEGVKLTWRHLKIWRVIIPPVFFRS